MIEILTNAEMAEADRLTIAGGVAGQTLMENAGSAVAETVAARLLAKRGYAATILLVGALEKLKGDAAASAKAWNGPIAAAAPAGLAGADIVVDALFGAGLDRPVDGAARAMIEAVNAQG